MVRTPVAHVEPAVLRWARESIGLIPVAASRKMNLPNDRVARWEAGDESPTIAQLRTAAKVYKRPLSVFFLPRPPSGFDVMRDFRRLPDAAEGTWSPALHGEYRRALQQREYALEIAELADEPPARTWRIPDPLPEGDEAIAQRMRSVLQEVAPIPLPNRRSSSPYEHLGYWIAALEDAGVLVFASQGVEGEEMRAFSLYFDPLPVIVVNGKDFPRGRLFSLLHEYAHLVLQTAGLCDTITDQRAITPDRQLEARCNAIAAAALMPRDQVLALPEVIARPGRSQQWDNETLQQAASAFGASSEAFLRRLLTLRHTTEQFYRQKRQELLELYEEELARRREESGGGGNYYRTRVRDLGKGYVRLVTSAQRRRLIDTYTAASFLDAKVQQLDRLAEFATLRDVA